MTLVSVNAKVRKVSCKFFTIYNQFLCVLDHEVLFKLTKLNKLRYMHRLFILTGKLLKNIMTSAVGAIHFSWNWFHCFVLVPTLVE